LPAGGISREEAIAAAVAAAPSGTTPQIVWAVLVDNPFQPPFERDWIWGVRLTGVDAPDCPADIRDHPPSPSNPPCIDRDDGLTAAIEFYSGDLIGWYH
jgi:hypothetical protein